MNKNVAVTGIFPTANSVEKCLTQVRSAGFRNTDISVLIPDGLSSKQSGNQEKRPKGESMGAGGHTNAITDDLVGWLAGAGTLSIAGIGSFLAAGPVRLALAGSGNSAAANSFVPALTRFGIPEFDAKRYESQLKTGNILFTCHCEGMDRVNRAQEVLQNCGAEDISTSSEVPADYMKTEQAGQRSYGATR
jgi:hypothetical protein